MFHFLSICVYVDISRLGPIKELLPHYDFYHIKMVIAILQVQYGMPVKVAASENSPPTRASSVSWRLFWTFSLKGWYSSGQTEFL